MVKHISALQKFLKECLLPEVYILEGFWGGVWAVVVVHCMPAWKPSLEDLQLAK